MDHRQAVCSNLSAPASLKAQRELYALQAVEGKKTREHYMWLPNDKQLWVFWEGEKEVILAARKSPASMHPYKSPVTLRAEIGKPVPVLYSFRSFQLILSCPLGVSLLPKVSFSTQLTLSIRPAHPCSAVTLPPLYLPGELTSHTVQWPQLLNYTACHCFCIAPLTGAITMIGRL